MTTNHLPYLVCRRQIMTVLLFLSFSHWPSIFQFFKGVCFEKKNFAFFGYSELQVFWGDSSYFNNEKFLFGILSIKQIFFGFIPPTNELFHVSVFILVACHIKFVSFFNRLDVFVLVFVRVSIELENVWYRNLFK